MLSSECWVLSKIWKFGAWLVVPLFMVAGFVIAPLSSATAQDTREIMRLGRGTANSLDWRPDGEVLAVGGGTGIWLYDEDFEELAHFEESSVDTVGWSPNGDRLAFADEAGVHIWMISEDGTAGEEQLSFQADDVLSIAWKPDGTQIAVDDYGNAVNIFDAESGRLIQNFVDSASSAEWSPDGNVLAVAGMEIIIVDATTWQTIKLIEDKDASFTVKWSPDGKTLATYCFDETFYDFGGNCLWDVETGNFVASQELAGIVWKPDGTSFLYYGGSGFENVQTWMQIIAWPSQEVLVDTGYGMPIRPIVWHPERTQLTGLTFDGTIVEWNANTGEVLTEQPLHSRGVQSLYWSPDASRIAAVNSSTISMWSIPSPANGLVVDPLFRFDTRAGTYTTGSVRVYWSDPDNFITVEQTFDYSGNVLHNILERDAVSGDVVKRIISGVVTRCAFSISSKLDKVACSQDDGLHILDIHSGDELAVIPMQKLDYVAWSPDDQVIAVSHYGTQDNPSATIEFWSLPEGDLLYSHESAFYNRLPRWSSNGQLVAAWIEDDTTARIHILDAHTYEEVTVINLGRDYIWSPDSHLIAVVQESQIEFYEAASGDLVQSIELKGVSALGWSPDGTMLALGMNDGTIRIWDVADLAVAEE